MQFTANNLRIFFHVPQKTRPEGAFSARVDALNGLLGDIRKRISQQTEIVAG
jgi:hypothetical protein